MGPDPVIISLACQIAKLKQWGMAWKQTALAKQQEVENAYRQVNGSQAELDRLRDALRQMTDERDRFRAAAIDAASSSKELRQKLEASEAESRGYFEELRAARQDACVEDETLLAAIQRMDRELDIAREQRDAFRAELHAYATHDTPTGKAAAQSAAIKVGDAVEVYQSSSTWTFIDDVGKTGTIARTETDPATGAEVVHLQEYPDDAFALCDVRKVDGGAA